MLTNKIAEDLLTIIGDPDPITEVTMDRIEDPSYHQKNEISDSKKGGALDAINQDMWRLNAPRNRLNLPEPWLDKQRLRDPSRSEKRKNPIVRILTRKTRTSFPRAHTR